MAIKYLAGKRLQGTSTERDSHMKVTPPQTSWKELGRTTLTSNGDSIDVRGTSVTRNVATFDGSNDYITFSTKFDVMQQAGSFSVWIKPANIGSTGNDIIFDNSDVSSLNNGFSIRHSDPSGSKTVVLFGIWGSTDSSITTDSEILTGDEWQHLVVTYDGTTGKIYRNGVLQKSGSMTANSSAGSYNARIGWGANGNDHKFDGKMAQALVYNDALTQSEVTTLYNSGTPIASPSTSGLVTKLDLTADTNDSQGSNNGTNTGVSFGSDTITGNFAAKDNLMVLTHALDNDNTIIPSYQFNGDTGNSYAFRYCIDGGSDGTATSSNGVNKIQWQNDGSAQECFGVGIISNLQGKEKLVLQHMASDGGAGAGNDPQREENVGKWANTSEQITNINVMNTQSGDFTTGSEVVVLGYDNDEADSGTNFWQELASVELTSASDSLDTGTFAAKKYLWVQIYRTRTGSVNSRIRVNGDSGSNYAHRYHGGANSYSESTSINQTSTYSHAATSNDSLTEYFFVNKADKEKLYLIEEANSGSSGAGNGTSRAEVAGKWVNTSDQITSIQCVNTDSGDLLSGTWIKVWGAD